MRASTIETHRRALPAEPMLGLPPYQSAVPVVWLLSEIWARLRDRFPV